MNFYMVISISAFLYLAPSNWFYPYLSPKSIQFGVRIPRDRESDPSIASVRKEYHGILLLGSLIIFILAFIVPLVLGLYQLMLLSALAEVALTHYAYIIAFRKLHGIKVEQKWYENITQNSGVVYLDGTPVTISLRGNYFLLPSLFTLALSAYMGAQRFLLNRTEIPTSFTLSGIPTAFSPDTFRAVFLFTIIQAMITLLMFLAGYSLVRTRQEIDMSRPYTTYEQQTKFKDFYRDLIYILTTFFGLTMFILSLRSWKYPDFTVSTVVAFAPLMVGILIYLTTRPLMGQMGSRLSVSGSGEEDTGVSNTDDDKDWRGGSVEFNRKDSSIIVAKRFGVGWTVNLGNPYTWLGVGIAIVAAVVILKHIFLL